ncbi:zeta toxin family protein [Sphingobacterium tabacisoli]|uniref:zeta toxin family protein n=1 Tax=Sphingobacterium tabacisoli TaxID=2044855 RepID=UPI00293D8C0F|nr:zeta toxin family protein [Sphingobacterium tabacisoli]
MSPFNPESVALSAGRIMLERIHELIKEGADFAFETTLSTKSYRNLVLDAQKKGYTVTLLYFWLDSPALAMQRVKKRVERGGHHIPDGVVERRYHRGQRKTNEDLNNSKADWAEKIRGGVQKALRKLAEESATKGESLVVKIDGEIR